MNSTEYKALQLKRAKARDKTIRYNPPFKLRAGWPATYRWIENASDGLRVIEPERRRSGYGYYVDNPCAEVTEPRIIKLPSHGPEEPLYMAACTDPYNEDCVLIDGDCTNELSTVTEWAYRLTEHYAEQCLEDDAKFQSEQQIEQLREDICEYRAEASRLVEEIRRARDLAGDIPLIVNAARKVLRQLRKDAGEAAKRIKALRVDPMSSVHPW